MSLSRGIAILLRKGLHKLNYPWHWKMESLFCVQKHIRHLKYLLTATTSVNKLSSHTKDNCSKDLTHYQHKWLPSFKMLIKIYHRINLTAASCTFTATFLKNNSITNKPSWYHFIWPYYLLTITSKTSLKTR